MADILKETALSGSYTANVTTAAIALRALGISFDYLSTRYKPLIDEIAGWEDKRVIIMKVMPQGPAISLKKENGKINFLGMGEYPTPSIKILFKNLDSGLMVLTAMMSTPKAFSEHRIMVHGTISTAMQVNRALDHVQTVLLPCILHKSLFKRLPEITSDLLKTKLGLFSALPFLLMRSVGRKA